jgi:hypothetical protein
MGPDLVATAITSQIRPRKIAIDNSSAGWSPLNSLAIARVAMRRKAFSPTATSATSIDSTFWRIPQSGEFTNRRS